MIKGLLMMSGWLICMCVYGPRRYKQLELSSNFQLLISGVFGLTIAVSMIGLMESVGVSVGIILIFLIACVIWAVIVRKRYPLEHIKANGVCKYVSEKVPVHDVALEESADIIGEQKGDDRAEHCERCGKGKIEGATFCPYCGKSYSKKRKNKKIKEKRRKKILVALIIIILTILAIGSGMALYSAWEYKCWAYDLSTMAEGYVSIYEPKNLYTKTVDGDIVISDSIYLSNSNVYINAVSALSGGIHTKEDTFYVSECGIYEVNDEYLYLEDLNGNLEKYKVLNQYLMSCDNFYSGEIPFKDTFDTTHIRIFDDGTEQKIQFFKDGTYVVTQDGQEETGTYIRDGYEIRCTSNNKEDIPLEFVVYEGKITLSYYKSYSDDADWIEYKMLIYKRDELQLELANSEKLHIIKYEKEHPISSGQ